MRDKRSRPSVVISYGPTRVLVDTTPELRLQCVANRVDRIDAIVFTHAHADHIMGLDDVRRFNAWRDLQEIDSAKFDAFVDGLSTRIINVPTPVTDYGCFPDGEGACPFSVQSVLGKGTPVWFLAKERRIVAKCTSSTPIRSFNFII